MNHEDIIKKMEGLNLIDRLMSDLSQGDFSLKQIIQPSKQLRFIHDQHLNSITFSQLRQFLVQSKDIH